jgi:hypothetical protein
MRRLEKVEEQFHGFPQADPFDTRNGISEELRIQVIVVPGGQDKRSTVVKREAQRACNEADYCRKIFQVGTSWICYELLLNSVGLRNFTPTILSPSRSVT